LPDIDYGAWEPKIHDFGDQYHLPDDLVFGNASEEIKKIKRKYGSFASYQAALITIEEYMENLVEKYGGIKHFKMMLSIGMVHEYVPPIPRLKKTKENMAQERLGVVFSTVDKDHQDFSVDQDIMVPQGEDEEIKGNGIQFVYRDYVDTVKVKTNKLQAITDEETIAQDLAMLQEYSQREGERLAREGKKKKSSRSLIKEAKRRKKELEKLNRPKTVSQILDDFVYNNEDHQDGDDQMMYYRGVLTRRDDVNSAKVANAFAAAGFDPKAEVENVGSKKLRKMIRVELDNSKKKKKKDKKKGDKEVNTQEEFDEFLDGYDESDAWGTNYKAWAKEMNLFNSKQMKKELDI